MNKQRRKAITEIMIKVNTIVDDAKCQLEELKDELNGIRNEEQEVLDNMPENLQGSERYELTEQAVENLDSAMESFEELIDAMDYDELCGYLEEAAE